jgi:hypothetical protein
MPDHGGHAQRITAWNFLYSRVLRWPERGGNAIVKFICNRQIPLSGSTKISLAHKCMPCLERKSEGRGPGRGVPSSTYSGYHGVRIDSPPVGT